MLAFVKVVPCRHFCSLSSLTFCSGVFSDFFVESAEMLRAVTGWDITEPELRETAARIVARKKAFNIREGWTPALDTLPERFLSQGLPSGASAGAVLPRERLQGMIRAYNLTRGWTEDGYLPQKLLSRLNLPDSALEEGLDA